MTAAEARHGAAHLVGDVQRFGLLSAATVVDRYTRLVERATSEAREAAGQPDPSDLGRLTDLATRVVDTGLRLADLAEPRPARVVLPPARPGETSEVALWVHNEGSAAAADVSLHLTSLVCGHGASLPATAAGLSPDRVPVVPAGSPREVRLRVVVPVGQAPGEYHGVLLTSAAPEEPTAVTLTVLADGPGPR